MQSTIFLCDSTPEGEQIGSALRDRGYLVHDVPVSLLVARVASRRPAMVVLDAAATGVADILERLREVCGNDLVPVFFVGEPHTLVGDIGTLVSNGSGHFVSRPIDLHDVLRQVELHIPLGLLFSHDIPADRDSSGPPSSIAEEHLSIPIPMPPPSVSVEALGTTSSMPPGVDPNAKEAPSSSVTSVNNTNVGVSMPGGPQTRPDPSASVPNSSGEQQMLRVSVELQRVLSLAEEKVALQHASSIPPTPDEDADAILPQEILDALSEPIDPDDDDLDDLDLSDAESVVRRERSASTGTGPRSPVIPAPRPSPASAASTDENARQQPIVERSAGEDELPYSLSSAQEPTPKPPQASARKRWSSTPPPTLSKTPPPPYNALPPDWIEPSSAAFRVPAPPHVSPVTHRGDLPMTPELDSETNTELPRTLLLGDRDGLMALGMAVANRTTGCAVFDGVDGVRWVVMREGDFVTVSTSRDDESLLAFLAERGELPRATVDELLPRLPAAGRHAAAALVAHGLLPQDQLWPVLRNHAEWLLGKVVSMAAGSLMIDPTTPAKLRSEPGLFDSASGAEVLVEVTRRFVSPDAAIRRLGGTRARLGDGSTTKLLVECGLSTTELELAEKARGFSVGELLQAAQDQNFACVLLALNVLGVFSTLAPVAGVSIAPAPVVDGLDDNAIRTRVKARLSLIEEGDYFAILGVPKSATPYEIRRAFVELRKSFDPSRLLTHGTLDLSESAQLIVQVLEEAFEVLKDPARRERYRRALEGPSPDRSR